MLSVTSQDAKAPHSSAFGRFYAGQALSYLGDGLFYITIPLLVFRLTGSATAIGVASGLERFPYMAVSLIGGSLADRVDRRRLMLACDGMRCLILLLLCALLATGRLTTALLYIGVFFLGICGAIFVSAQAPAIRYVLGKEGVKSGVAALQTTSETVNLVSPPLGGAIMSVAGALPALLINATTYLCSQLAIASVPTFGPDERSGMPSLAKISSDVAFGWKQLTSDAALRASTWLILLFNFMGTIGFVALIPYFKRAFGASDASIGIAFGCFSAAGALGAYIGGKTNLHVGTARIVYPVSALTWLPLPWTHAMPLAVLFVALSCVGGGYIVTTIGSWRLRVVADDAVGRVLSVVRVFLAAGLLPASIAGGWLGDHVGIRDTVGISAFGCVAVGLAIVASRTLRRECR